LLEGHLKTIKTAYFSSLSEVTNTMTQFFQMPNQDDEESIFASWKRSGQETLSRLRSHVTPFKKQYIILAGCVLTGGIASIPFFHRDSPKSEAPKIVNLAPPPAKDEDTDLSSEVEDQTTAWDNARLDYYLAKDAYKFVLQIDRASVRTKKEELDEKRFIYVRITEATLTQLTKFCGSNKLSAFCSSTIHSPSDLDDEDFAVTLPTVKLASELLEREDRAEVPDTKAKTTIAAPKLSRQ
jgi:hypothetical protein